MPSTMLKRLVVAIVVIGAMIGVALFMTRPTVLWSKTYVLPNGRHIAVSINRLRQGGIYLDLAERRGWFEGMGRWQSSRIAETATREEIKIIENPDRTTLTAKIGPTHCEINLNAFDVRQTPSDD